MKHAPAPDPARSRPVDVLDEVALRLRSNPHLGLAHLPFRLALEEGTLEIDGEVRNVAVKRRAVETAASVPGVRWVVDRLRVAPAEHLADGMIRDHVVNALLNEPTLLECGLRRLAKGSYESVREPLAAHRGEIRVGVDDGVVTLDGEVPTRAHQRIAIVLAWWVPGTRDVVDALDLLSREDDNDEELADAIRMALEKDPFVAASQIRVSATGGTATLTGFVPNETQREMAEHDAWYVLGVTNVINSIDVG